LKFTLLDPSYRLACLAVIAARYRTLLQYRAAALAGLGTQILWAAIRIMVIVAFYELNPEGQPISLMQLVAYVWLGQALLGMFPTNVDTEIAEMIRSGAVSYEMVRPLGLYNFWFRRTIALRTATTTLRSIPMLVFAIVLLPLLGMSEWSLTLAPDTAALLGFASSLLLPLACISYFPVLAILSKDDPLGSNLTFQVLSPTLGFVFLGLTFYFFYFGVGKYTSTGS
jgi:ABC-2 type transport system permease protein